MMSDDLLLLDIQRRMKQLPEISDRIWRQVYHRDIHPSDFPDWKGEVHLLPFSDADEEISALFCETGLDSKNPIHWRALLEIFCKAYVKRKSPPSNRSKEWVGTEDATLAANILGVWAKQSRLNATETARQLRKLPEYKQLSEATLRKHVSRMNDQKMLQLAVEFPVTIKDIFETTAEIARKSKKVKKPPA
jgi:hypothetical protein